MSAYLHPVLQPAVPHTPWPSPIAKQKKKKDFPLTRRRKQLIFLTNSLLYFKWPCSVGVEWEPAAREALPITIRKTPLRFKKAYLRAFSSEEHYLEFLANVRPIGCRNLRESEPGEKKIELKKKETSGETRRECSVGGGSSKWERCAVSVSKQNHPAFFKLNWTLNHFGRGKYDTVLFLLSSNASAHER